MSFTAPGRDLFVRDFSAGYLDTPEPDALPPGATPDAANTQFARILRGGDSTRVSIKKRDGFRLVTPLAPAYNVGIDGMEMYQRAGTTNVLLVGTNGTLYRFDNIDTLIAIVGGFTAGNPMRFAFMRGQCLVTDGTKMQRIDSTLGAFTIGQVAPTAAPGLATAAGPGVTGTYEGFAVWYDPTTDHESSPSAISARVVFANQQRQWTKPAGAPAANYSKWRIYTRRTDTNEANYFRSGTFDTSAGTGTEAVSDGARVNIGPLPGVNNPPPGAFDILVTWRSYAIGVLPNGSDLYFSKLNEFQSWNPTDVFRVAAGKERIRSIWILGENIIIHTGTQSFTLEGDRVPFRVVDLHANTGNVSQESAVVVDAEGLGTRLFLWDVQKGPTATNGAAWSNLADDRITVLTARVNRTLLHRIRCGHHPLTHVVFWAFPVGSSTRLLTLIAYDYRLDRWLPPVTGLTFSAFAVFINSGTGSIGTYMGDAYGRVYEMFSGRNDGVPSGFTTIATVTSATASTVDAAAATFYTTGHGLGGQLVCVKSPAGAWQWRRVLSNTATTITLDTVNDVPWETVPVAGWTVVVGGIRWYWTTPVLDYGRPDRLKRGAYLTVSGKTESPGTYVEVRGRFNSELSLTDSEWMSFASSAGVGVWGEAIWGVSLFGQTNVLARKQRVGRSFYTVQYQFQNYYPDQVVSLVGYGVDGDVMPRKRTIGPAS